MRSWKCRTTDASVLGIEIASASPAAVLNSTTYVPSVFGPKIMIRFLPLTVVSFCSILPPLRATRSPHGSSTRPQSDCGTPPQWRRLGSRIEYRLAWPRADSGRGGLGCVVHGGTHQSLVRHCGSLVGVRPD